MQLAYRIPPNRAQAGTRAAKWINPEKNELLIPTREAAYAHISAFETQLKAKMPRHKRAELLIARAMIYEALGTPGMVSAALDAWDCTKTAVTAHLMAVAYHHIGNLPEAVKFYERAYAYPHEAGFNIDLAYTQALLFKGEWTRAHKMTLGLKKRMVYAAYLPEWDGKFVPELSIISEGGFGDLIQMGRWIPVICEMGIKATVYLPPYFFDSGFVDLWRAQKWCPDIKLLTEVPMKTPAVGFFDLPAIFNVQPENIPPPLIFETDSERVKKFKSTFSGMPQVGFCWAAKQQETPLVGAGVYRSLTDAQADKIITASIGKIRLTKLQKEYDELLAPMQRPQINSWVDTAAIIENLDAVICVDTAVAHLAASMGKPTYLILSGASDWKFGMKGEICPWYPTIKIIRNDAFGFDTAVEKVTTLISNAEFNNHDRKCS